MCFSGPTAVIPVSPPEKHRVRVHHEATCWVSAATLFVARGLTLCPPPSLCVYVAAVKGVDLDHSTILLLSLSVYSISRKHRCLEIPAPPVTHSSVVTIDMFPTNAETSPGKCQLTVSHETG